MSGLRPIQPLKLPGVKPAAIGTDRPEVVWTAPTSLMVDGSYQRDLSERSIRVIRNTVENFAWNRVKAPIVVREGAALHIIDGQHTAIAAATLGIAEIPVFVVRADRMDERARAFVGHNTDRVIVSPFDIYRARLAAGDADAVDVSNVCKRAGVRIRNISPSSSIAEGDCAAVGVVRALVKRRGVLRGRQVLQCLVNARCAPISAAEIQAAERMILVDKPTPDLEALAQAIRLDGAAGLARARAKAKTERVPVWQVLTQRWGRRLRADTAAELA